MKIELDLYLSEKYRAIEFEAIDQDSVAIRLIQKDGKIVGLGSVDREELRNVGKFL